MKRQIRINPVTKLGYIPKDLIDAGYVGDVEVLINAVTATIIKPGTDLQSVKRSLEITIQDIELRLQQGDV